MDLLPLYIQDIRNREWRIRVESLKKLNDFQDLAIGHGLMSERRTNNNYTEMKMLAMRKE